MNSAIKMCINTLRQQAKNCRQFFVDGEAEMLENQADAMEKELKELKIKIKQCKSIIEDLRIGKEALRNNLQKKMKIG